MATSCTSCSTCLQRASTNSESLSAVSTVPVAVSKLPLLSLFPPMSLQVVPLPTPMTREEITSYRPAQDPPIDPSQGQAPVQVSTNLAVEPRPPPRASVMSTAEIAAYRSGEDPAYDPVERRGWWEVDMAQGRPLSILLFPMGPL